MPNGSPHCGKPRKLWQTAAGQPGSSFTAAGEIATSTAVAGIAPMVDSIGVDTSRPGSDRSHPSKSVAVLGIPSTRVPVTTG